jgi:hypothetical protein
MSMGSSPISSRKTVPPRAASNAPGRATCALVKAPFAWPKSSASMRLGGMELQSMTTNGPEARGLCWWIAGARLAFEEDGGVGGGDLWEEREDAAHGGALAEDAAVALFVAQGLAHGVGEEFEPDSALAGADDSARLEVDRLQAVAGD